MRTKLLFISIGISMSMHAGNFCQTFKPEYDNAISFLRTNREIIQNTAAYYNNDTAAVVSIIFPELIRYSITKDFLETKALEYLYVNGGKNAADFSIGNFQMKPSFIEKLEWQVKSNFQLKNKYKNVITYLSNNTVGIRSERVARLKSTEWQIIYANCFYEAMLLRFPDLKTKSKIARIQFIATAYNVGFERSILEINQLGELKTFPYGSKYKGEQYAYKDIAVNFYKKFYRTYIN